MRNQWRRCINSALFFATIGFILVLAVTTNAHATIIRTVEIIPSSDQIYANGEFGMGSFWHPTFDLEHFALGGAGDVVDVTVRFPDNWRVNVTAGIQDQESVGASIGYPSGQRTFYEATWEFLDVQGDLPVSTFSQIGNSEGDGIGANFNPINLTDTSFSFGGVHYTFVILSSPYLKGLPAAFDRGMISVQTQGQFTFTQSTTSVPEPASMLLFGIGLIGVTGLRRVFQK